LAMKDHVAPRSGSSSSSKAWLNEHVNDHWVKEARKLGYRSRAAFKLLQLQESDKLIKTGDLVLDLGSAPGSWSQVAVKLVGLEGAVIASDILPMLRIGDVTFIQGDFTDDSVRGELSVVLAQRGKWMDRADVLLSDMAPNLSGNTLLDQDRSYGLVELALNQADDWLKRGGNCAVKVFRGNGYDECLDLMKTKFKEVRMRKPAASRGRTNEAFLIGIGFERLTEEDLELRRLEAQAVQEEADRRFAAEAPKAQKGSAKQRSRQAELDDGMADDDDYF